MNRDCASGLSIGSGIGLLDGTRMPRLGFGTLGLGDMSEARGKVEGALEAGYRLIDCARIYGTERGVGAAIAASGIPRSELYVTSKVWNDRQIHGGVRDSVLESLEALGLDHLDLLLIHWPVPGCWRRTWDLFQEIRDEGLTTSIGVSNFTCDDLSQLLAEGGAVPVVNQVEYHVHYQDEPMLSLCRAHGVVCEAWAPFGTAECASEPVIADIAREHGATVRQVMLAWMVQRGIVPLPRTGSVLHARENARALDVRLGEAELQALCSLDRGEPRREHVIVDKPSPHD